MTNLLRRIYYFKDLSDEQIARLADIAFLKKYEKGEHVFTEGETSSFLHVLIKGSLKVYKTNPKGQELFVHRLQPVTLVAELANFSNVPFPASVAFISSGEVIKIEYKSFKEQFLSNTELCLKIITSLCEKLRFMSEFVHQEMILSAEAKIAKCMVENTEIFTQIKQNQIASFLNMAPETFSRILGKLKSDGIISLEKDKTLILHDEDYLRSLYEI